MREHVGSSKSPLLGRRETPSKTRRHEDTVLPCAGISPSSKSVTGKLGGFTCSFAEIRLKKSLETGFRWLRDGIHRQFIPMSRKNQARNRRNSLFFLAEKVGITVSEPPIVLFPCFLTLADRSGFWVKAASFELNFSVFEVTIRWAGKSCP